MSSLRSSTEITLLGVGVLQRGHTDLKNTSPFSGLTATLLGEMCLWATVEISHLVKTGNSGTETSMKVTKCPTD